jgi:hypothetical protein
VKIVFLVGPPRCGMRRISSLLATCEGTFTCEFAEFAAKCETLLATRGCVIYRRLPTRGAYTMPASFLLRATTFTVEEIESLLDGLEKEATANGWDVKSHLIVNARMALPLFRCLCLHRPEDLVWLCVRRCPQKAAQSCIDTMWMPRMRFEAWRQYVTRLLCTMSDLVKETKLWATVDSELVFAGNTSQLAAVANILEVPWTNATVGGSNANKPK